MAISAADDLFYGEGVRATSMDAIAERAGVTKRTLYYHFRSKDDLPACPSIDASPANCTTPRDTIRPTRMETLRKSGCVFHGQRKSVVVFLLKIFS